MEQDLHFKVIAKAWKDPEFRKKLISNPRDTLNSLGYGIPNDIEVKVIEDDVHQFTFVLPSTPSDIQSLDESQLKKIAAGGESRGASCGCIR